MVTAQNLTCKRSPKITLALALFALNGACSSGDVELLVSVGPSFVSDTLTLDTSGVGLGVSDGTNDLILFGVRFVAADVALDSTVLEPGPAVVEVRTSLGEELDQVEAEIEEGTYDAINFNLALLAEGSSPEDEELNPGLIGHSVEVRGEYNTEIVIVTFDALGPLSLALADTNLESSPEEVLVEVDIVSWFESNGALIDPETTDAGEIAQIEANILSSFSIP